MTQIEQIKAEIERLKNWVEDNQLSNDFYDGAMGALLSLTSFIKSLEQEQIEEISQKLPLISQGLDEAAERIVMSLVPTLGQKYEDGSYVQGTRDYFSRDELIGLVKAGAEWMAGQGATMEITDDTEWADLDSFVHKNVTGGSIIQIRKK